MGRCGMRGVPVRPARGHASLGLVSQHGLGFLFGSQTCYRISQKAEGELGRGGTWFNPADLTDQNIWGEGRGRSRWNRRDRAAKLERLRN